MTVHLTRRFASRTAAAALTLGAAFAVMGTASAAAPTADVLSATVRYADLNLSTVEGARTLYRRIAFVAKQVCPGSDSRELFRIARSQVCQKEAIERAVHQVNSPHLATLYATRTRRG